ncbi:serine hydrolase [Micromonospora sonneratiae]|uniref:Serine hydrolase domain-containing protein n=1 Tax=Micromonospora sonneratiae TaxID=1184706 RepID=A0ABW3Y8I7_9ACTN
MFRRLLAASLTALVAAMLLDAPARADDPTSAVTAVSDEVITRQLDDYDIPGAAVVVVAGGRQLFAKGYGVADLATRTPVTPDTGFFMGSVAKLFTAEAVNQLATQGKIDLHADVNRYLTGFRIRDTHPGHPITTHHLLTHTAGFSDTALGVAVAHPAEVEPLGTWLRRHQPPRVRPPGTLASYDNYGFALAGHLVETVSGQSFPDYVDQHILRPLGMTSTSFAQPSPAPVAAKLARGYRADGVEARGQYGAMAPTGAGAVTTATDMGRFMLAQLRPGNPLTAERFTHDPRLPGIGYAYEHHVRSGQRVVAKDGDVPGYHDNLVLLPDAGIGIYVAYDGDGSDGSATFAGHDLANRIIDRLYPNQAAVPTTAGTGLDAFTGTYRTTRYSHRDFTKFATLTSAVTVGVADGGLTTTGLSDDPNNPTQRWRQISPGLFTDGTQKILFRDGLLFSTVSPSVAYEKLPWYATPTLHLVVAMVALLALLVGLFWWPIAAVRRRRAVSSAAARLTTLTGWLTAASFLGFTVLLAVVLGDGAALNDHIFLDDSVPLTVALVLFLVAAVTTFGMLTGTIVAWVRRWWSRAGRIGYTATAAAAVSLLAVGATYNLIVW